MEDDLNTALALAVVWEMLKSEISANAKKSLVIFMDSVLGLTLGLEDKQDLIPNEIQELLKERDKSREEKNWEKADDARKKIEAMGYKVLDTKDGSKAEKA